MTDEEKKAIHDLKILRQGISFLNCIPGVEKDEIDIKAIDVVLNLIEKQQKEIEKIEADIKSDRVRQLETALHRWCSEERDEEFEL